MSYLMVFKASNENEYIKHGIGIHHIIVFNKGDNCNDTAIEKLKTVLPIEVELIKIHCTIFEDNNSCTEMAKYSKMSVGTKNISLKYHHSRSMVKDRMISIKYINTED